MEDDQRPQPESLLPYERWIANALRHVVVQAIEHVAAHGLPGDHHFYIAFRTDYPGVVIPPRLRAQYPEEMTIVLQHQFWDLKLDHEARTIRVGLSFGGAPSILVIPLDALVSFADPQIRYALRFDPIPPEPKTTALAPVPSADKAQGHQFLGNRRQADRSQGEQSDAEDAARTGKADADPPQGTDAPKEEKPQVVSLDAFRRRPPPKN